MKHTKHLLVLWAALLLGAGNAWGVTSGTTYTLTSSNGVPTGWTITGDIGSSYTKLSQNAVIQTDVFCISSISSIQLNARYYGGSGNTAKITITWVDTSSSTESILGTITPTTNKETASYTLSSSSFSNTPSSNSEGYLKFEAKSATSSKYAGIQAITITFTAGTCSTSPTTVYLGLFLAAFVAVRACVRRVECLDATFHHIIMSKIDFRSVHFAKECFVCFFCFCCSFLLLDQKKRTKEKSRLWRLRCQKFVVSVSAKSNSLRSDSDLAFRHAQLDF